VAQELMQRLPCLLITCAAVAAFGGCTDPRFQKQQALRDAQIKDHLSVYAAYDAAGPDRIRQTLDLDKKLTEYHAKHLAQTSELIRSLHERDLRRWNEEAALRRARLEALLRGKPEQIPEVWAKLVY
jgi:hypothetical protein